MKGINNMATMIRCDECGRQVEYDEEVDAPVPHACLDDTPDCDSLQELDFDND